MLEEAPSNISEFGNGAKTYSFLVKTAVVDLARIGAHKHNSSAVFKREQRPQTYSSMAAASQLQTKNLKDATQENSDL